MSKSSKFAPAAALVGLLAISPSALAEVYKCVDEATGKMTFTDSACPDKGTGDYVPVGPANSDSGYESDRAFNRQHAQQQRSGKTNSAAKWQRLAEEQARKESAKKHMEKADRLNNEAEWSRDP